MFIQVIFSYRISAKALKIHLGNLEGKNLSKLCENLKFSMFALKVLYCFFNFFTNLDKRAIVLC